MQREQQAVLEFMRRTKRGMYLHLPLWLVIAMCVGWFADNPLVFWANSAGFALMTVLKILFLRRAAKLVEHNPRLVRQVVRALIFTSALHWSALAVLATLPGPLNALMLPLMLVTVGLATAGTVVLAVDRVVRFWFPILTLIPIGVGFLLDQPGPIGKLFAPMAVLVIAYVSAATRVVHDDYWAALEYRALLEQRARTLELVSATDSLTQIPNRLHFEARLKDVWSHAASAQNPVSLLLVDLDHFKRINDEHGHLLGDECLKAAARALVGGIVRKSDLVARWGGEEFVVLLPDANRDTAKLIAQRLLRAIASTPIPYPGGSIRLTCSIGLATQYPEFRGNSNSLMDDADQALYGAKSKGRNCVVMAA